MGLTSSPVPSHGSLDPGSGTGGETSHRNYTPTEPAKGWIYVVRWCTENGTQKTKWYRHGAAARRYADWLAERFIPSRIYRTDVTRWQEDHPPQTTRLVRRRAS